MIHFDRVFAPAVRNADIGVFFPARVFLADARAVAVNSPGTSFAGINSLMLETKDAENYSRIRLSGFLTVCSR